MTLIGHSQGSIVMLINLARNETYMKKNTNLIVAFGPLINAPTITPVNWCISALFTVLDPIVGHLGLYDSLGYHSPIAFFSQTACTHSKILCDFGQ
jgi:lysosomal acid lipase/cholesteryl ester hydrolase